MRWTEHDTYEHAGQHDAITDSSVEQRLHTGFHLAELRLPVAHACCRLNER